MIKILQGDWIEQLRPLPAASVHMCVTSPPYWSLRDYGVVGQLGLEKTPEEYVAKLVEGFREVRRVLRDDATCWINLGDSYARNGGEPGGGNRELLHMEGTQSRMLKIPEGSGLKPKDLVGIPWRVAFALQADGWYLRSKIPWIKRNSMPESVTDRPSSAVEEVFLFSKSEKYFFDAEAIRVKYKEDSLARYNSAMMGTAPTGRQPNGDADRRIREKGKREPNHLGRQRRNSDWWFESWQGLYSEGEALLGFVVNPSPYKDAHFATYPPELVKPCILAGTSARGCCPKCGAPWERIVQQVSPPKSHRNPPRPKMAGNDQMAAGVRANGDNLNGPELAAWRAANPPTETWQPACDCYGGTWAAEFSGREGEPPLSGTLTPCTVLDPFGGSGTTGQVAMELGRKAILIELNPKYVELMKARTNVTPGLPLA